MHSFIKKVAVAVLVSLVAEQVTKQIGPAVNAVVENWLNQSSK